MGSKKLLPLGVLLLGIGFATVTTTLIMTGNVKIATNDRDFDVIFTKAVLDGTDTPSAITDGGKSITFGTKDLITIGDVSKLDFEVTNNSELYDAEVSINCTGGANENTYYTITKEVPETIAAKRKGTGKVQVTLNKAVADENGISEPFTCTLTATAKERTEIGEEVAPPATFAEDSWDTIVDAVKSGNTSVYTVGSTKEVDMGSLGKHTLRVANNSTPAECSTEGFSQTACGFVLEFADIIATHNMNPNGGTYGTNVGGWPATPMRTYVNNDIYNALPSDLKGAIIDTTVVSGHGSTSGETNFTSEDKLYLLSTKEVWGTANYDTVDSETRQLDYYRENGVTLSNYSGAVKKNGSSDYSWWLRAAHSGSTNGFHIVRSFGSSSYTFANSSCGVSPAFRIA